DANCSAALAGLAGGNGTIATFLIRDSAAAEGFSVRASGAAAGLREVAATLTGARAAAGAAACASSPPAPERLARTPGIRLRWAPSEGDALWSCPFDSTLASCASGMRGQWRTLPVSMCTKGAPDVG